MSSINFDNAYWLLIALPILIIIAVPFAIAVRKDNVNGHNIASLCIHVVMAAIIAFAAAGAHIVNVVTETNVYVLADVSYSANKNLDEIDGYIKNLSGNLPRNSKAGVICFGRDYKLVAGMGSNLKRVSVKNSGVDDTATDINGALEYAGSLFKDGVIKRIVLITDGTQSDSRANLKTAVDSLKAQGVKFDAIYLNDNLPDGVNEVQISGARFTATAYAGGEERAAVRIQSSYSVNAILDVTKNGEAFIRRAATLSEGENTVYFDLDTAATGEYVYEVKIEAEGDENDKNNVYRFTQVVSDRVKVLLITSKVGDTQALNEIYGGKADIQSFNVTTNKNFTYYTVEKLINFDEIVLSDVDVSTLKNYTMFVDSLDTVVSRFGKSLVTFGDMHIQNRGDDVLKKLQDMLPVRYGNNSQDPKLYTIVFDSSRSMELNYRLIIAKQAAKNLIGLLNPEDYVAIVKFHGQVEVLQQPVMKGQYENEILNLIENIDVTQGTCIGAGLKEAMDVMLPVASLYSDKQLMLISDGLSYTAEKDNPLEIVDGLNSVGVVCSVIDVGRNDPNDPEVSKPAEQQLKDIAANGKGNYYLVDTVDKIDKAMFGDIADDVTDTVVNKDSKVEVKRLKDDILTGIDAENIPNVTGFYNSSAKASATNVLTVNYERSGGGKVHVPLYSYWKSGNGKVATFTSTLSGGWVSGWQRGGVMEKFITNVLDVNVPAEKLSTPYNLEVESLGDYTKVEIRPASISANASAKLSITLPDGEKLEKDFISNGATYYYEFATLVAGDYKIDVTYNYGGTDYSTQAAYSLSYYAEYDSFALYDASSLQSIAAGGTVSLDGNLKIENPESEQEIYVFYLTLPLMIVCVVLYVADIVVRKLKWKDVVGLFKKVSK